MFYKRFEERFALEKDADGSGAQLPGPSCSPAPRRLQCDLGESRLPSTLLALVYLVVRHHPDELKDLLPAGDKARAQHVVHAEGLGGRGGRRSRVVRGISQLVQNEPVAVVGYAQAVCGLAKGGKVGADPGGQPSACPARRQPSRGRPVRRTTGGCDGRLRRALHGPQGPGYPEAHALPPDRPGRQRRPASRVVFVVRVIS